MSRKQSKRIPYIGMQSLRPTASQPFHVSLRSMLERMRLYTGVVKAPVNGAIQLGCRGYMLLKELRCSYVVGICRPGYMPLRELKRSYEFRVCWSGKTACLRLLHHSQKPQAFTCAVLDMCDKVEVVCRLSAAKMSLQTPKIDLRFYTHPSTGFRSVDLSIDINL